MEWTTKFQRESFERHVRKFRTGETIPIGATYLYSKAEARVETDYDWPGAATVEKYEVHYYEVLGKGEKDGRV